MPIAPDGTPLPYDQPMMGGDPSMMAPGDAEAVSSATEILEQILDLADSYRQQEESQQNLLLVEKLRTLAQQILANEEKEMDGMFSGKVSPAAIRRFSG